MFIIKTVDIIKLHAATTFYLCISFSSVFILCVLCKVFTKDMYLCIYVIPECCVFVWCTQTHLYFCQFVFIYVCTCVDRESGWLLPTAWQLYTKARHHHHHSAGPSLRYIPRRAVLYCPGNDERKLRKLATLDVDCAVLDCEDGVALSKKVQNTQMHLCK